MRVKVPLGMWLAIGRLLMKAHGIGKSGGEEIVVADGQAPQDGGEIIALNVTQVRKTRGVAPAEDHRFKGPHGPVRNQRYEPFVLADNALMAFELHAQVLAKQALTVRLLVFALCGEFP